MIPQRLWQFWHTLIITWTPASTSVKSGEILPATAAEADAGFTRLPMAAPAASVPLICRNRRRFISGFKMVLLPFFSDSAMSFTSLGPSQFA